MDTPNKILQQPIAGCNCATYFPDDYATSKNSYPLWIILNGSGERTPATFTNTGMWKRIAGGWKPQVALSDGSIVKFIVLGFTDAGYGWPTLDAVINYVVANARVDVNHIIGTGLSQGATDLLNYKLGVNSPSLSARLMKAMVLVSTPVETGPSDAQFNAATPVVVQFYTGSNDTLAAPVFDQYYVDELNKYNAVKSTLTVKQGSGHDASEWDFVYNDDNTYIKALQSNPSPIVQPIPVVPIPPKTTIGTTTKSLIITNYSDGTNDISIK